MADIVDAARGKVVEDEYLVPAVQIGIGQMRPDETRATRDQDTHESKVPRLNERSTARLYADSSNLVS